MLYYVVYFTDVYMYVFMSMYVYMYVCIVYIYNNTDKICYLLYLYLPYSMATPIVAAAAILVKQYFEEPSAPSSSSYDTDTDTNTPTAHRWNTICRTSYRSCPVVNSGVDYVSGVLVKAVLVSPN